tara:strand:- start:1123 stop:1368 length:246 start_codon:yes stop_codon:yes gene_type:complete
MSLLNDKCYKVIDKKFPNYCLNHSIIRSGGKQVLFPHRDDRNPPPNSNEVCCLQFGLAPEETSKNNGCAIVFQNLIKKYLR